MILLILAIATIIGLVVSLSKAIRFLRNEEVSSAKTWGLIALTIISVFLIFVWLYKKIKGTDNQTLISGNLGNTFNSNWKEGDYVILSINKDVRILGTYPPERTGDGIMRTTEVPYMDLKVNTPEKPYSIHGYITKGTDEYQIRTIGPNGISEGITYKVKIVDVLSIKKISVPVEG